MLRVALVLALLLTGCAGRPTVRYQQRDQNVPAAGQQWTFDAGEAGRPPAGSTVFGGTWTVRTVPDAPSPPNALCQVGVDDKAFSALGLGDAIYADLTFSARVKPFAGQTNQDAGLLFRVQDRDNYDLLRASPTGGDLALYRATGGRPTLLQRGPADVTADDWQVLRVDVRGPDVRGFLNGRLVVEGDDDVFAAGKIGVWTQGDALACFDDVEARLP